MPKIIDRIGQKFNRLTVISRAPNKPNRRGTIWNCVCECGNSVTVQLNNLTSGNTKSCGCWNNEVRTKRLTKHGLYGTPEYLTYHAMKARCLNQNEKCFKHYGGRGITICDSWLESFDNFLNDMGNRPSLNHSIDRIDNDGDYTPKNCRWVVVKVQANNKRNNRLLTANGKTQTLQQWAEEVGIHDRTIRDRLVRGWSEEKAINTPVTCSYH